MANSISTVCQQDGCKPCISSHGSITHLACSIAVTCACTHAVDMSETPTRIWISRTCLQSPLAHLLIVGFEPPARRACEDSGCRHAGPTTQAGRR